jgi:hypothetical protein
MFRACPYLIGPFEELRVDFGKNAQLPNRIGNHISLVQDRKCLEVAGIVVEIVMNNDDVSQFGIVGEGDAQIDKTLPVGQTSSMVAAVFSQEIADDARRSSDSGLPCM